MVPRTMSPRVHGWSDALTDETDNLWWVLAAIVLATAGAFVVSALLVRMLILFGVRARLLDTTGGKGHEKSLRLIPNVGGVGIFWASVGPLGLALLGLSFIGPENLLPEALLDFAPHVQAQLPSWLVIVGAALALHVMGLIDDRRPLGAGPKLLIQLGLAVAVVLPFDEMRLLHALDAFGLAGWMLSFTLTILWLLIVTNALNFMDNMDGLAGGVGAIAALVLLFATLLNGQIFVALTLALLLGAMLGFLVFNFPPARIFMGDGGSLVIGWMLAVLTVRTTFVDTSDSNYALGSAPYGVLMPLVVLAVPLYDFASVMVIRIGQGKSPFVGDQQHFSHRLRQRGLSARGAVLMIWSIALVTGISGIFLGSVMPWQAILIGVQTVLLLCVLAALESSLRSVDGPGGGG